MRHPPDDRIGPGTERLYTEQVTRYRDDVRAMLSIAIPLAFAELGWMSMSVVDNIMVGRLPDSATAIGAASIGSAFFYTFAIFGVGLMSGLDTLVSQAFGAGDLPAARGALVSGLVLAVCGAPLLAGCILGTAPLLAAIGVTNPLRDQAIGFSRVLVWSLPLLLVYTTFRRYLQGLHHVRPVTFALISSNLVNVIGNWILIYGHWGAPAMGIRGSALSTVFARVYLAGVLVVAVCLRDPGALRGGRASLARIGELLRLGLPAAMTIAFEVGVFHTSTALAGKLDPASLAAHTIALNAASVTYMVPLGIASAAAVSVGRALGAKNRRRAVRAGWVALAIAVLFEIGSALAFVLLPRQIARVYTLDPGVISIAFNLFLVAAVFQIFDGLQTVAAGALRGMGNTRTPMVWNLVCYWVIGLPLGYWLCFTRGWGVVGLWDGLCLALVLIGAGLVGVWAQYS
jgi:multidrug resistance protein, MATE family